MPNDSTSNSRRLLTIGVGLLAVVLFSLALYLALDPSRQDYSVAECEDECNRGSVTCENGRRCNCEFGDNGQGDFCYQWVCSQDASCSGSGSTPECGSCSGNGDCASGVCCGCGLCGGVNYTCNQICSENACSGGGPDEPEPPDEPNPPNPPDEPEDPPIGGSSTTSQQSSSSGGGTTSSITSVSDSDPRCPQGGVILSQNRCLGNYLGCDLDNYTPLFYQNEGYSCCKCEPNASTPGTSISATVPGGSLPDTALEDDFPIYFIAGLALLIIGWLFLQGDAALNIVNGGVYSLLRRLNFRSKYIRESKSEFEERFTSEDNQPS